MTSHKTWKVHKCGWLISDKFRLSTISMIMALLTTTIFLHALTESGPGRIRHTSLSSRSGGCILLFWQWRLWVEKTNKQKKKLSVWINKFHSCGSNKAWTTAVSFKPWYVPCFVIVDSYSLLLWDIRIEKTNETDHMIIVHQCSKIWIQDSAEWKINLLMAISMLQRLQLKTHWMHALCVVKFKATQRRLSSDFKVKVSSSFLI